MFGNIAAAKIWNLMTYAFLVISSLCVNITE